MSFSTLYVCVTCRREADDSDEPRPGARLYAAVQRALADTVEGPALVAVECLSNCRRSCSTAVAAPDKWTYVVGNLDPEQHVADIIAFARLHQAHEAGLPAWRERPLHIRRNTVARVPPLRSSMERT